jgi:putative FmdB family regulatory protein
VPIYEYLCEACGTLAEMMQKVTDAPLKKCPECGSKKVAKLVSRTSFQLKGGGWYADLYSSTRKDREKKGQGGGDAAPAPADGAQAAAPPAAAAPVSSPSPSAPSPAGPSPASRRKRRA